MSEFDQLYREVILDHYKNPRGHGLLEDADAQAEGQNPLCGDEVTIYVALRRGRRHDRRGEFEGRGCAITQAATSMLTEIVSRAGTPTRSRAMPKEELLEEIGIPLTPVRLKCALLGLGVLKVALHKAKGTPLPGGVGAGPTTSTIYVVADGRRLPGRRAAAGHVKIVHVGPDRDRRLQLRRRALRARGPLLARRRAALRGRVRAATSGVAICPRHGARFDIRTGAPLTLPAYEPVETFPVRVEDGMVKVELSELDASLDVRATSLRATSYRRRGNERSPRRPARRWPPSRRRALDVSGRGCPG